MQDPWKYLAFPLAAVAGYSASMIATEGISEALGLPNFAANLAIIAFAGLLAGFLIDDLIPAYIEKIRGGNSSASSDFDNSGFDDSDMEGDIDFD